MNKYSLSALVAAGLLAGGMTAGSASAADLGGNCCADLEERIAELEATTARKGNRKVSLTVSGWVGQQVMFWDDGGESNVYVHDLGSTLASHVKFTGSATISPGWSAGYVLHLEAVGADSLSINQGNDNGGNANSVSTLQSFWFVKSESLGKLSVGKQSQASDNTAILVDGSGSLVPANWVAFDVNSFGIRNANTGVLQPGLAWGGGYCAGMGGAWGDCFGGTTNSVRYDSPSFGGFSVSASWGEDDFWDVAARYAGEFGGFKLAAAGAYTETNDQDFYGAGLTGLGLNGADLQYYQAGVYIEHVASGLFAYGAYGHNELDGGNLNPASNNVSETWYGKVGLRTRLTPLGHSIFYGEYLNAQGEDGLSQSAVDANSILVDDETTMWGGGVVQEIDAAAMSVWVKYRNLSYDDNIAGRSYEDFDYVGVGALINF